MAKDTAAQITLEDEQQICEHPIHPSIAGRLGLVRAFSDLCGGLGVDLTRRSGFAASPQTSFVEVQEVQVLALVDGKYAN